MTTAELLTELQTELAERFDVDAEILYTRAVDVVEISRRFVLHPATYSCERVGMTGPRRAFGVDLLSEEHVAAQDVEDHARECVAFFERVAESFTRKPLVGAAFCLSVTTFDDAPGSVNTQIVENGLSLVLAGVRMTFVEN